MCWKRQWCGGHDGLRPASAPPVSCVRLDHGRTACRGRTSSRPGRKMNTIAEEKTSALACVERGMIPQSGTTTRGGNKMNNYAVARYSLLLQIVLPRAARIAPRKGTLMVLLASVYPCMSGKVTAGSECAVTSSTYMFLLRNWVLNYRNNGLFHK